MKTNAEKQFDIVGLVALGTAGVLLAILTGIKWLIQLSGICYVIWAILCIIQFLHIAKEA